MIIPTYHFIGGQKSAIKNNFLMENSDLELAFNVWNTPDNFGCIEKRPGTDKVGNTIGAGNVLGMFDGADNAGNHKHIVNHGTKLYYNNAGTWTDPSTGSKTWTAGNNVEYLNFLNKVFISNGQDAMSDWDFSTTFDSANVTSAPVVKYMVQFGDRIYGTGNSTNKSRVYYSSTPTAGAISWTSGNGNFDEFTDDGDFATGLNVSNSRLQVFKNESLTIRDVYRNRLAQFRGIGTPAHRSIANISNMTYFFYKDRANGYAGIYEFNGTNRPKIVSGPIQDWVDAMDQTKMSGLVAWQEGGCYCLYAGADITLSGYTGNVLVYDTIGQRCFVWYMPYSIKCAASVSVSSALNSYIANDAGKIYKITGNSDENAAGTDIGIDSCIRTKKYNIDDISKRKGVSSAMIYSEEAIGSEVNYRIDGKSEPAGQIDSEYKNIPIGSSGTVKSREIQLEITDSSKSNFLIKGLSFEPVSIDNKPLNA